MRSELPTINEHRRFSSPAVTPQALAWDGKHLWMSSRDLHRIYKIDPRTWSVLEEKGAPGIPWAAVATNGSLRFTIGEGADDDRYARSYDPARGFGEDRIACPEFTGSYLSFDGENLYLSQWYKHRILKLDANRKILRIINVGAERKSLMKIGGSRGLIPGKKRRRWKTWRAFRSRVAHSHSTVRISGRIIAPLTKSSHSRFGTSQSAVFDYDERSLTRLSKGSSIFRWTGV
jgi:hypothetical protein